MDDTKPPESNAVTVVWTEGHWRCESWMTSPFFGWVVLYRDSELALQRPVKTADAVPAIAEFWRKAVCGETEGLLIAEPSDVEFQTGADRVAEAAARKTGAGASSPACSALRTPTSRARGVHQATRSGYRSVTRLDDVPRRAHEAVQ